jgi:putative transposase
LRCPSRGAGWSSSHDLSSRIDKGDRIQKQIIAILNEHEAGTKTSDLCRKHGISEASFYNWKAKYGGLEVSEAKRLKGLESENARLKKLLAMRDNAALKDLRQKNGDAPCQARGCRSPAFCVRIERAAGVSDHRLCADDGAASFAPRRRWAIAGPATGLGS